MKMVFNFEPKEIAEISYELLKEEPSNINDVVSVKAIAEDVYDSSGWIGAARAVVVKINGKQVFDHLFPVDADAEAMEMVQSIQQVINKMAEAFKG